MGQGEYVGGLRGMERGVIRACLVGCMSLS
jgi:hypothetical protein